MVVRRFRSNVDNAAYHISTVVSLRVQATGRMSSASYQDKIIESNVKVRPLVHYTYTYHFMVEGAGENKVE